MNIKNIFLINFLLVIYNLHAQEIEPAENNEVYAIHIGSYTPFGNQIGARVGINLPFKRWIKETNKQESRIHRIEISPKLGYFVQPDIQRNYLLDMALEYKWYKPTRKIHPKVAIALGYLLARQNIGGVNNLANGDISFEKRTLNFFVPTINIGFERNRKNLIGYYFSFFYGRKLTSQEVNSDLLGAELGITFNFKKN